MHPAGPTSNFTCIGANRLSLNTMLDQVVAWSRRSHRYATRAGQTVGGYSAWSCRSVWAKAGYQRR